MSPIDITLLVAYLAGLLASFVVILMHLARDYGDDRDRETEGLLCIGALLLAALWPAVMSMALLGHLLSRAAKKLGLM